MIKAQVVVKQPRIKADKTATLSLATTEELGLTDYEDLNELAYNGDTVTVIVLRDDEYIDGIRQLADELLTQNVTNV